MTEAHRIGRYVGVAAIAIAVGAAGMFAALRWPAASAPTGASVATGHGAQMRMPPAADDEPSVEGEGVYISPARQQLIGVRTARVEARDIANTIRTTGALTYDETRVTQVHTKIAGWIDQLFVDFVGKPVRKGDPLFTIYSPDLVATQNEYLLARHAHDRLMGSTFEDTRQGAASLIAAARRRLELWDVSPEQIAELERTGEPRKTLTFYAPASGIVLERSVFAGQYVTPEITAFKLADLSTLWAVGEMFEADLPHVHLNQPVAVELSNTPGARPLTGHVTFIAPDVDAATRRIRVRADINNSNLALKPDTFVTMTFQEGAAHALAVPAEAVIDTGVKQYVIVARGRGYFEPRVISVGAPAIGYYPVTRGLSDGEEVVTSAQFLIDSETNLQAAMQMMNGAPASPSGDVAIDIRTDPPAPRVGDNSFQIKVTDAEGRPVADAAVSVALFMAAMPSMNMPAMRTMATLAHAGGGLYRGVAQAPMSGRWDATIAVTRGSQPVASKHVSLVVR